MYEFLKKLLPKSVRTQNEQGLRWLVSLAYRGNTFQCPICEVRLARFIKKKNGDQLCPRCGSLARTRRLWMLLLPKLKGKTILHFSPSSCIKSRLALETGIQYVTTDYAGEFQATKKLNIESIDEPSDTYDLVICYHVLEHIENDSQAMKELFRILKPQGECIIQTPFKAGSIYENALLTSKEERLLHFGQQDHLRIYSVMGLKARLDRVGFKTETKEYHSEPANRFGFKLHEYILIATKP